MSEPVKFEAPEIDELNEWLEGYRVSSLIATGGMGAVYRATQVSLDREVAIKVLPKEFGSETFRDQFQSEARAMARLNHPNLIGIYDFGEANGLPYIVMEFVAGKSLYYSSYGKAVDQRVAVKLVAGICRGLQHAHQAGIIHRDIKPANILLDASAEPKIGDFGLAGPTESGGDQGGMVYGTPGYVAPEILGDPDLVGVRSDLYAVGVILYELLTGKMPEEPATPPSLVAKCDPRLDGIFKKAVRRNPEMRYASAGEMADELEKILTSLRSLQPRKVVTSDGGRGVAGGVVLKRRMVSDAEAGGKEAGDGKPKLVRLEDKERRSPAEKKVEEKKEVPVGPVASPIPVKVGEGNWPIIRNLLIIAILIPIIIFTWGIYQKRLAKQEEERQVQQREVKAEASLSAAEEERRKLEMEEAQRVADAKRAEEEERERRRLEEEAREAAKTPMDLLAELQASLVRGGRAEFPRGTIDRTSHALFVVDTPMTWNEASRFAEAHGGYLATPETGADLDLITGLMTGGIERLWLGGGARGRSGWGWVDGRPWQHGDPGTTLGTCAAVIKSGTIRGRPNAEMNPFVIQWSKDGQNPGSLEAQLDRLVPSLDRPSPEWPPTSVAHENRVFLLVDREVSWSEADLIATGAGGHLAVISTPLEGIFIRNYLRDSISNGQAAWLGGRLRGENWGWVTGESWERANWLPGSPDGGEAATALRFFVGDGELGWDDATPGEGNAVGFLIEWSSDRERAPTPEAGASDGLEASELVSLRQLARRRVNHEVGEHRKAMVAAATDFQWFLRGWFRRLSHEQQEKFGERLTALQERIPEDGDLGKGLDFEGFPEEVVVAESKSVARQEKAKQELEEKMEGLRLAYVGKLVELRDRIEAAGLKTELDRVDGEIRAAGQSGSDFRAQFED